LARHVGGGPQRRPHQALAPFPVRLTHKRCILQEASSLEQNVKGKAVSAEAKRAQAVASIRREEAVLAQQASELAGQVRSKKHACCACSSWLVHTASTRSSCLSLPAHLYVHALTHIVCVAVSAVACCCPQIRQLESQLAQLRSQAAEVEDKRAKLQQRQSVALDALSASTGRKIAVGQCCAQH
jgi:DNA repair exonuclease SbcCD ATPase subunit